VANYNVDIAVALKGAEKLGRFNKQIKDVADNIKGANTFLQSFSKGSEGLARSVNNLQTNLNLANKNLKSAALGTKEATIAAYQFLKAQEQINKGLREEALLLKEVEKNMRFSRFARAGIRETSNQYSGPIGPGQASNILGGQSVPAEGKIQRTLDLRRDEIKLQEALYALELKSAATLNEKLEIQGQLNRQTAQAVNDIKLRGQFSPLTSDVRGNIYDVKSRIEGNTLASRRAKFRNVFSGVSGRDYGQLGGRIGPVEPIRSEGGFLAFSKAATKIQKDTKNIAVSTKKSSQILSQQATAANFGALTGQAQGFLPGSGFGMAGGQIGPRQPLRNRLGFGRNALPGPFAMQGGAMGRVRGGVGSALIGGGFPALFGAGGLSSVLGGLAGGLGGALAPGGGFAASIFATAIAAEIEKIRNFRKAVRTLNEDLKNAGATTQFTRKEIKQLGRDLDITKEEATELVAQFSKFADVGGLDLARLFGSRDLFDATIGLNDFSSTLTRIQQLSEQLTLGTEFEAYKILSEEGVEAANDFIVNSLLASKQADIFSDRFEENLKRVERLGEVSKFLRFDGVNPFADITTFDEEFRGVITQFAKENAEIQAILNDTSKPLAQRLKEIDAILIPMIQDTDLLREALSKLPPEFDLSTEKAKQLVDALSANVENLMFLEEFKAPEEELKKLSKAQRVVLDLSKEIKTSFAESFKGIVKGTMSVTDAFRNMLNRIGDYFLDLAAQVMALGIQKSFLGLFQNMFNIQMPAIDGAMANGGKVRGRGTYLVGERGAELFTPGVSGTITPNESLGGSTNIVVNVDASGSSVEGDEEQGRELGRMISVAIQSELIKQKRPGGLLT